MSDFRIDVDASADAALKAAAQTAEAFKKTEEATKAAAEEAKRYQAALEQLQKSQDSQAGRTGSGRTAKSARMEEDAAWLAGMRERREALKGLKQATTEAADADLAAMGGSAQATEKATKAKQNLKGVIMQLTQEFPLLRQAGLLAINPVVAAASIGAMTFGFLRSKIAEIEQSIETSNWEGYGSRAAAGMDLAKRATESFKGAVDELTKAQTEAEAAGERLRDVFNAQLSAEERRDEAAKRLETEQARGIEDPVERQRKLLEIEDRYSAKSLEREERKRNFEVDRAQKKVAEQKDAAAVMDKQLATLQDNQARLGDPEDIAKQLKAVEENYDKTSKEFVQKTERREALNELLSQGPGSPMQYQELAALGEQIPILWQERELLQRRIPRLKERQSLASANLSALGLVQQNRATLQQRIDGAEGMLPTQMAVAGIQGGAAQDAARMDSRSRLTAAANDTRDAIQKTQGQLEQTLEASGAVSQTTLRLLERYRAQLEDYERRIRALEGKPPRI
jgi:hypothetical protein